MTRIVSYKRKDDRRSILDILEDDKYLPSETMERGVNNGAGGPGIKPGFQSTYENQFASQGAFFQYRNTSAPVPETTGGAYAGDASGGRFLTNRQFVSRGGPITEVPAPTGYNTQQPDSRAVPQTVWVGEETTTQVSIPNSLPTIQRPHIHNKPPEGMRQQQPNTQLRLQSCFECVGGGDAREPQRGEMSLFPTSNNNPPNVVVPCYGGEGPSAEEDTVDSCHQGSCSYERQQARQSGSQGWSQNDFGGSQDAREDLALASEVLGRIKAIRRKSLANPPPSMGNTSHEIPPRPSVGEVLDGVAVRHRSQKRRIEDDLLERHRQKQEEQDLLRNAIRLIERQRREVTINGRSVQILRETGHPGGRSGATSQNVQGQLQPDSHHHEHQQRGEDSGGSLFGDIAAEPDNISQLGTERRPRGKDQGLGITRSVSSLRHPIKSSEELQLEEATFKPKINEYQLQGTAQGPHTRSVFGAGINMALANRPDSRGLSEMLYQQGVGRKQKMREREEERRKAQYKTEAEVYKVKTPTTIPQGQERTINRLLSDWQKQQEDLKRRKMEEESKKLEGYTFRPEIHEIADLQQQREKARSSGRDGGEADVSANVRYREQKAEELFLSRCESAKKERERASSLLNKRLKWNPGVTIPMEFKFNGSGHRSGSITGNNSMVYHSRGDESTLQGRNSSVQSPDSCQALADHDCNTASSQPILALRPPVQANWNAPSLAVSLAIGKVKAEKPRGTESEHLVSSRTVAHFDATELPGSPFLMVNEEQ